MLDFLVDSLVPATLRESNGCDKQLTGWALVAHSVQVLRDRSWWFVSRGIVGRLHVPASYEFTM